MPILYLDSASFNNIQVSGSITLSGSTSLQGTSSWATNALTASSADAFTVRGNLIVSGNTTIGDAITDSITMTAATMSLGSGTGILNIDSNTFVVDGANNRVYINQQAGNATLDISGTVSVGGSGTVLVGTQVASGTTGTASTTYRLTNTGGNVTPLFVNASAGGLGAGSIFLMSDNTNGLVFAAGNGTRQIARAGIQITNLVNTAGSESADLIFSTKPASPGNTAMIERVRINSTGTTTITGSLITSGSRIQIGNTIFSGSLIFAAPTSPSFNGEIVQFGAGTLTTGQLYFLSSSGTWSLANANSTDSSIGMLGLAVGSSPTANGLLIRGFAASSSYTYGTGSIVYMATSSGLMTATSPSSSNHVVRVMGYQTTLANTIYFDPDKTWVTLA